MNRGHNENAVRLAALAGDAQIALDKVAKGETDAIDGWLAYGAALNEGRSLFPGDREFGQWISANNLNLMETFDLKREAHAGGFSSSNLGKADIHPGEQSAAIWAAAHRDQFEEARAAGKARTVRGIHDKWKQIEAEREKARLDSERAAESERKRAEAEAARKDADEKAAAEAEARAIAAAAKTETDRREAEAKVAEAAEAKAEAEQVAVEAEAEVENQVEPDREMAALRKEFRRLTQEAQEDDWIGLRLSLADAHRTIAAQKADLENLNAWWAATNNGTDKNRGLAMADRQVRTADARMKEYQTQAVRAERRAKALEVENKRLKAEIANQEIIL